MRLPAFLAGIVLLGAVGSCELPNPKIPSVGLVTEAGVAAVPAPGAGITAGIVPARRGGAC